MNLHAKRQRRAAKGLPVYAGLEVGISVAGVALCGEPTGVTTGRDADVVGSAKRDLRPGDLLDNEKEFSA